jgi:filamentous hemagglutinin family protein
MTKKIRFPLMRLAAALALCATAGVGASQAQANGTRINPHVQMPTNYVKAPTTSTTPSKPALAGNALPVNGQVSAGQATISQSGNAMTVQQTTARAVINWDSYNVGSKASVTYQQPNSSAVTLNRVTGATASQINGAISANGTIIISNSNGVTFGRGAQVDAAAVVATTLNQSDQEFMSGSTTWSGGSTGKVVNRGTITATSANGYIALLAPEVRNEGYVLATVSGNNSVAFASGQNITLNFSGNQLVGNGD